MEKELKLSKIKFERLYEDKISGLIDNDFFLKIRKKILIREQEIEDELSILKKKIQLNEEISIDKYINDIINGLSMDSTLIGCLIDKIYLSEDGEIFIYYKVKN